ncbi:MAG: alpha/beta hydrolase-fold protein [Pseudomonadota bacterium]
MKYEKAFLQTELVPDGCKYATLAPENNPGGLPLLFLFHGGQGDRRFLSTMQPLIEQAVAEGWIDPIVVATPSARMSYYMDYQDGSEKWESMICTELLQKIKNDHQVDTSRLLVSGISMGGVGCLRLAFRNPERFIAVASLEAGVDPFLSLADKPAWYALNEDTRLGSKFGTPIDEAFWRANNPANIVQDSPGVLKNLKIYLEVGTHDGLFNHHNVEFLHRVLFDQHIKHEYRTYLGANHIGNSIPGRFSDALKFLGAALRPTPVDEAADKLTQTVLQNYQAQSIAPPEPHSH